MTLHAMATPGMSLDGGRYKNFLDGIQAGLASSGMGNCACQRSRTELAWPLLDALDLLVVVPSVAAGSARQGFVDSIMTGMYLQESLVLSTACVAATGTAMGGWYWRLSRRALVGLHGAG